MNADDCAEALLADEEEARMAPKCAYYTQRTQLITAREISPYTATSRNRTPSLRTALQPLPNEAPQSERNAGDPLCSCATEVPVYSTFLFVFFFVFTVPPKISLRP